MGRHTGAWRALTAVLGATLAASVLAACGTDTGSSEAPPPPIVGSIQFDQDAAIASNGLMQRPDIGVVCGSTTATFGAELVDTPPDQAKVSFEWGAIRQDAEAQSRNAARAGTDLHSWQLYAEPKQMFASGTVQGFQLSTGDLTFTHPFGVDMTMDIKTDRPYAPLDLLLGLNTPANAATSVHIEIEQGLVPHGGPGLSDFLPGYAPQNGDRIAAAGPWVLDCGHDDFHSELHPLTFLAFGHTEGTATVAHAFYNPYRVTQLLSADPALVTAFGDLSRFDDPTVKPFPPYLVGELLRVGHVAEPFHDRIEAHQMLKPNDIPLAPWFVCAPGEGSKLQYSYSFVTRPGVSITAAQEGLGCVRFTATIGPSYTPLEPIRKDCIDPWTVLNTQLQAALGDPSIDIKTLIEQQVPASFIPNVEHDPVVDCYDPLVVTAPAGGDRSVTSSGTQPYPFYGEMRVSWSS